MNAQQQRLAELLQRFVVRRAPDNGYYVRDQHLMKPVSLWQPSHADATDERFKIAGTLAKQMERELARVEREGRYARTRIGG